MNHTSMCEMTKRVADGAMGRETRFQQMAVAFSQQASENCPACQEKKVQALGAGK